MKIGFIGLGIMGKPMAKNLLKAGHEVVCFDVNQKNVDEVVKAGAVAGKSSADVAAQVPLVITMLPNSPHVKSVVMGEGGILEGAKKGLIIVDMSSIAPLASQEIEKACAEKGVRMLDAPVSGGEPKAIDGSLAIMVGGDKALFEEVKDILMVMGASAVHCGPIGAGNTTKLANQIIVALNIAAVAEAFTLVRKAGGARAGLRGDQGRPCRLHGHERKGPDDDESTSSPASRSTSISRTWPTHWIPATGWAARSR